MGDCLLSPGGCSSFFYQNISCLFVVFFSVIDTKSLKKVVADPSWVLLWIAI